MIFFEIGLFRTQKTQHCFRENTSQDITKTIVETSNINNKGLENLNNKLLEIMNDRGILSSYLMSLLSKITTPEKTSQFKLVKDSSSIRVHDLKLNKTITITLYNNLTFRDTGKEFEFKGDFLRIRTNKNYNVDLASSQDKKILYDFAKEMNFNTKNQGIKSTRARIFIKLFKSPVSMVSASGVSKAIFLSSDPTELCDKLILLLQEKQTGNNLVLTNQAIIAIVDELLQYKCISKKQHKQLLIKHKLIQE